VTRTKPIRAGLPPFVRGFSTVELVVATAIALILFAMAVPSVMTIYQTYQLNDAATQLSGMVKFTRFEAIRKNGTITCVNTQATPLTAASVWATSTPGETAAQPTEKQILLGLSATLVNAGSVPSATALPSAAGLTSVTAINPSSGSISFDARGAVSFGANPQTVYVYFIGSGADTSARFRAVLVLPSGSVQVWTSQAASSWVRVS
jgi:Tfp pilus assembly protein FimT